MKMDKRKAAFRQAISCLPPIRRAQLEQLDRPEDIEELRFRAGQPPAARTAVGERPLPLEAVTSAELREMLSRAAQYSVHSYTDSLRHGFLTLSGGHRLGICGTAAEEDGRVLGVRGLSSINLRIAHQAEDLQAQIARWIGTDEPQSALLLSPPGYGKTTLLERVGALLLRPRFHCCDCGRAQRDCRSRGRRTAACSWTLHGCDGRLLKMAGGGHAAQNHVACPARS